MSLAEQINTIIEQMPEKKQVLVYELIKAMVSPDDILTNEDIADIRKARAEFARGEFVRHENIKWN